MRRITIAFVGLALILSACSSAAEVLTEQIAENALGGDVKIDAESGQVSIETDEGAITIGGGEVPAGFTIALPDGYTVSSVFTNDESQAVSIVYPNGDYDGIVSFFDDWTAGQSGEWSRSSSSISTDDGSLDSTNWSLDGGGSFVSVTNLCIVPTEDIDPENCIAVNATVSE
ncbi:MAG: hypothetical protein M3132_06825 [Actinomycetia bacterium]|nr:hypothetical protein [Actinomycetes bacterium]